MGEVVELDYPTKRKVDGVYFRVKRGGKFENVCFSDLTNYERHLVVNDWSSKPLLMLADEVASAIYHMNLLMGTRPIKNENTLERLRSAVCKIGAAVHEIGECCDIICGEEGFVFTKGGDEDDDAVPKMR